MRDVEALLSADRAGRGPASLNVCLVVSGSIAAYKACEFASRLVKAGHEVQALMTENALRFVGEMSMEGITGRKALTDLWAPRESMAHISLRKWTDIFVFYPATANRINALAAGLAPDLLGATFLANNFEKPFWIAPAMNSCMLAHPATRAALEKLESWGARLLYGEAGRLACGDAGLGRLMEPAEAFALVQEEAARVARARRGGTPKRLLLTGGAMTEPVDAVRSIVNTSTGRTAGAIARAFLDSGWGVDYLHHESAALEGSEGANLVRYRGFPDFKAAIETLLSENAYDAIVHAAAVSDYRVARDGADGGSAVPASKLESGPPLALRLEPNPKIVSSLRGLAKGKPLIVAFKLTSGADAAEGGKRARSMIASGAADAVVWNDLSGLGKGSHDFIVFSSGGVEAARGSDNSSLAKALLDVAERNQHA